VIFRFVVRKLKWVAKIPGAPQLFDAMLLAATALFHSRRLRAISALEATLKDRPGMSLGVHRLGGIGFFFRGREVGHVHGNGLLDCLVGRANRDSLLESGRASSHHIFPRSGWISFWIEGAEDVPRAAGLIEIACAHRGEAS